MKFPSPPPVSRALPSILLAVLAWACAAPAPLAPRSAQTRDGRKAYLLGPMQGRVTIVDRWNGGIEATLDLPGRAADILVAERAHAAVVSVAGEGGAPGRLAFVNTASNAVESELSEGIGTRPGALALSPDGRLLYVANRDAGDVSVVVLAEDSPRVVQRVPVGGVPLALEASWPEERLWVVTEGGDAPREVEVTGLEAWRTPPPAPTDPATAGTQVLVLGMIHGGHRTSERWGLEQVAQTIRAFAPDVVLCEIPPDRWARARDEYERTGVVEEPRVRRFPEYVEVLLPLRAELGFAVEPCAAWTQEMSDLRNRRLRALESDPSLAALRAAYEQAEAEVAAALEANPIIDDDPRVIHSDAYDARTHLELGPYDRFLDRYLGPGGWTAINRAHLRLIEAALDRHRGERVLITFGAGHKDPILRRLRERPDVRLVDAARYLPRPPTR